MSDWSRNVDITLREIASAIPSNERFILVDDGQFSSEVLATGRSIPFLERDGVYWGAPTDDDMAMRELERLRQSGARFIAFVWPAFWWLDHYIGLHKYLRSNAGRGVENDRLVLFELPPIAIASDMNHGDGEKLVDATIDAEDEGIIDRVLSERLTYLGYRALADLDEAVRQLDRDGIEGRIIEAGCALGGSALVISGAKSRARTFYVYDLYGMIPAPSIEDEDDAHERYRIINSGESKGIRDGLYYGYETGLYQKVEENFVRYGLEPNRNAIHMIKGLYQETLQVSEPVALAHIDCDWYESVMTCLQRIEPNLVAGGILIIDDYHCWPGCRRAVDEYFDNKRDQYHFSTKARLHIVKKGAVT